MPQRNSEAQREQLALAGAVGVGEGTDGLAQEGELAADVAAAPADRQVRAQGRDLAGTVS